MSTFVPAVGVSAFDDHLVGGELDRAHGVPLRSGHAGHREAVLFGLELLEALTGSRGGRAGTVTLSARISALGCAAKALDTGAADAARKPETVAAPPATSTIPSTAAIKRVLRLPMKGL